MGDCGQMGKRNGQETGFQGRLLRSLAGSAMVLVAVAILPLAALICAGVDMGRAYMAATAKLRRFVRSTFPHPAPVTGCQG